jgi:hypothetical protein
LLNPYRHELLNKTMSEIKRLKQFREVLIKNNIIGFKSNQNIGSLKGTVFFVSMMVYLKRLVPAVKEDLINDKGSACMNLI